MSIVMSICASRRDATGVVRDGQRPPARRGVGASALVIIAIAFTAPAAAETIRLDLPIDCVIGETCVIQVYVDRDPGPGAADFACGPLTSDGHKGTDFRIPDLEAMRRGVAVLAAAAGRVTGIRDGMADVSVREIGVAALKGRDCGNGAVIDHGNGWVTQYCHMRRGSIAVKSGDRVKASQKLGLVGLSGRTEFPHLHLSVRFRDRPVDPFVGATEATGCDVPRRPLWRDAAADNLVYRAAGLINAGFTDRPPEMAEIEAGAHRLMSLPSSAGALIFWVRIFGLRPGDRQHLRVTGPEGAVLVDARPEDVDRPKAQWMSFAGKRRPPRGWPAGTYRGEYTLIRGGETLIEISREIRVHERN